MAGDDRSHRQRRLASFSCRSQDPVKVFALTLLSRNAPPAERLDAVYQSTADTNWFRAPPTDPGAPDLVLARHQSRGDLRLLRAWLCGWHLLCRLWSVSGTDLAAGQHRFGGRHARRLARFPWPVSRLVLDQCHAFRGAAFGRRGDLADQCDRPHYRRPADPEAATAGWLVHPL